MLRRALFAGVRLSRRPVSSRRAIAAIERGLGRASSTTTPFDRDVVDHAGPQLPVGRQGLWPVWRGGLRLRRGRADLDHRLSLQQIYPRPGCRLQQSRHLATATTTAASSTASRPSPRSCGFRARRSTAGSTGWSAAITPTKSCGSTTTVAYGEDYARYANCLVAANFAARRCPDHPGAGRLRLDLLQSSWSRRSDVRAALVRPVNAAVGAAPVHDGSQSPTLSITALGAFAQLNNTGLPAAVSSGEFQRARSDQRLHQSRDRAWRPGTRQTLNGAGARRYLPAGEQQLGAVHPQYLRHHRPAHADGRRPLHA